jgi:hypothetical protein
MKDEAEEDGGGGNSVAPEDDVVIFVPLISVADRACPFDSALGHVREEQNMTHAETSRRGRAAFPWPEQILECDLCRGDTGLRVLRRVSQRKGYRHAGVVHREACEDILH